MAQNVDYKVKYEQTRMQITKLVELSNRACQDYHDLQKRFIESNKEHEKMKKKLEEKESLLKKLQTVSEAVCQDYNKLKNKYKVESEAISINMKKASKWYQENKTLKRQSAMLMKKMGSLKTFDIDIDNVDDVDHQTQNDIEIQDLKEQIKDLKREIRVLNTQLAEESEKVIVKEERIAEVNDFVSKLQKNHKDQVQQIILKEETDREEVNTKYADALERVRHKDEKIAEHEETIVQLQRVSALVVQEFNELKKEQEEALEVAKNAVEEARNVRKERNALVRKSEVLFIDSSPNEKLEEALKEVDDLSNKMEDMKLKYETQMEELKEKVDEKMQQELEEKLQKKIEILEIELGRTEQKLQKLEEEQKTKIKKILELEKKLVRVHEEVERIPQAPPPPPPPPPPPASTNPIRSLMSIISNNKKTSSKNKIAQKVDPRNLVIDEMMNKIKCGEVTLRKTGILVKQESIEETGAVDEMMSILTKLKKSSTSDLTENVKSEDVQPKNELQQIFQKRRKVVEFPDINRE